MTELLVAHMDMVIKDEEKKSVCLGIACNKYQAPEFWIPLVAARGPVTHFAWSQNAVAELEPSDYMARFSSARGALTDTNRNQVVTYFLDHTDCDYLFQLDDDVKIYHSLEKTVGRLLAHEYPICSGIYYRGCDPYGPIGFIQEPESKGYAHLPDWEPGSLIKVDAVGMGCTLIHREVFEEMKKQFAIVMDWRGAYRLEHPDDTDHFAPSDQIITMDDLPDYARFPWYALQYMRTEDLYFCENAKRIGYDIWLDTSLELDHLQTLPINRGHFLNARERYGKESEIWRRQ